MIVPLEETIVIQVIGCPVCRKYWTPSKYPDALLEVCTAAHKPGQCCHLGWQEVPFRIVEYAQNIIRKTAEKNPGICTHGLDPKPQE